MRRIGFLWFVICFGLLVWIGWPWFNYTDLNFSTASGNARLYQPFSYPTFQKQLDEKEIYKETLSRPLFTATRRPVNLLIKSTPDNKKEKDFSKYRLTGIVHTKGRKMILLEKLNGQVLKGHVGETVDGWVIEKIELQNVILAYGEHRINLLTKLPEKRGITGRNTRWVPSTGQGQ